MVISIIAILAVIGITVVPQMTPELEKLLDRVEEDIKKGRNLSPGFKNMDEAIDYLKKQSFSPR